MKNGWRIVTVVATVLMLVFAMLAYLQNRELRSMQEDLNEIKEWRIWWNKTVPGMDADQNARIRALERVVFDEGG